MPKSARYAGPVGEARRMLEGLTSRWIIPMEWRCARAVKRSWIICFASAADGGAGLRSSVSRFRGWKGKTRR